MNTFSFSNFQTVDLPDGNISFGVRANIGNFYELGNSIPEVKNKILELVKNTFPKHKILEKDQREFWLFPHCPFTASKYIDTLFTLEPVLSPTVSIY